MRFQSQAVLAAVVLAVSFLVRMAATASEPELAAPRTADAKFIGASKCKSCHQAEAKGNQYDRWAGGPHARAFDTLASGKAKEIAREKGIADPQASDQCLRCHVTAYGVDAKLTKALKNTEGVGCEACHGAGDPHFKARFLASAKASGEFTALPEGEIQARPALETCLQCHNEDSPTFKPFCFRSRWQTIAHLDPRKGRTKEQLEAMKCACGESCDCEKGECGAPYDQ